jgi:hypothetical protein
VVDLVADIPSVVTPEWACLVTPEWACLVAQEWAWGAVATSDDFIFIGSFGFPGWWDWGWGYPYAYYGGYNYGGYGSSYGYGDSSRSRVAELQTRLAPAGYYHGFIDGVLGPQTRRAIRAYERDHGYAG